MIRQLASVELVIQNEAQRSEGSAVAFAVVSAMPVNRQVGQFGACHPQGSEDLQVCFDVFSGDHTPTRKNRGLLP
jgi:hypothetical protein